MVAARGSRSSLCPRESPPHLGGEAAARAPAEWGLAVALDGRRRPLARLCLTWRTGGRPVPLRAFVPGARRRGRGPLSRRSAARSPRAARRGDAPAPGRGSRAALFRARPRASQAQPTRPFPSPSRCLRARDPLGARHSAPASAGCSLFGLAARAFFVCVTRIR